MCMKLPHMFIINYNIILGLIDMSNITLTWDTRKYAIRMISLSGEDQSFMVIYQGY